MKKFDHYSDKLLEGDIFIHTSVGYVSKEEDFWNEKLNNKTYQIYVHSLPFLKYLSESYNHTKNRRYLIEGEKLLNKWIDINHKSEHIMHEQPVAARVNNILRFSQYGYDSIPHNILKLIKDHIEFLLDDKNYKKNNHGIMMDTSLSNTLKYIPSELKNIEQIIVEKVITRSQEAINRDFSSANLHLENSPDYHRLTVKWLGNIEKNLNLVNQTLGKKYVEKLNEAMELDSIIAMPNLRYPIYGDSSDGTFKGEKKYTDYVDKEAGRVIFQNEERKSQLTFISGYGSKGHKHFDDLSFIFYDGNEVLFNDSGKYNYNKKDKVRQHLISPLAHNSLSIYKKNYRITSLESDKSSITIDSYKINDDYKIVKGINRNYKKTELIRYMIILKDDTIIMYDKFNSDFQNTIAVNFNLGLNVQATPISRGMYLIEGRKNYILKSHFGKFTSVILNDSNLTPCKISNRFNMYESNQRILFRQKTRAGFFLTTLSKTENDFEITEFNHKNLIVQNNNKVYEIDLEI